MVLIILAGLLVLLIIDGIFARRGHKTLWFWLIMVVILGWFWLRPERYAAAPAHEIEG